ESDISELSQLLRIDRPWNREAGAAGVEVVALVGLAGVGKTGLAHGVAHAAAAMGWTAVSVTLTDISQPSDIYAAVAAVFGVARPDELFERYAAAEPGPDLAPALLVLDGADRSPRAAVDALRWLRARVPAVRLLVTSREPLAAEVPG